MTAVTTHRADEAGTRTHINTDLRRRKKFAAEGRLHARDVCNWKYFRGTKHKYWEFFNFGSGPRGRN